MADKKIAILGGKGMLGSDLLLACQQRGFNTEVFDLPEFDITDREQLSSVVKEADIVINCAAYTNVEKAESKAEIAYKVNAEAVGNLGALAKDASIWVLHLSTDFVFDGQNDKPYVETNMPNPINVYGKSKLAGEQLLIESACHHCIMRIEWTYGIKGNNFVAKMISLSKQHEQLKVIDDQIGSPTATTQVAEVICELLKKKPEGIFHFASEGYVSRFGMAEFIFNNLNIPIKILPCKTADYKTAANRPLNSRFDCSKIKELLGYKIKPWQKSLENFLEKL